MKRLLLLLATMLVVLIASAAAWLVTYAWRNNLDLANAIGFAVSPPAPGPTAAYADIDLHEPDLVRWLGNIRERRLRESSGLETSSRSPDVVWSHNDSGNPPELYALSPSGRHLGVWRVDIERQGDWEDMSAFERDGVPYLLIADVGDNFRWRREVRLLVVREPDVDSNQTQALPIEWTVRVEYPDGPRDSEAVAVTGDGKHVILISKRAVPAEIYRVPLRPTNNDRVVATRLGELTYIPQPDDNDHYESPRYGETRSMPTALDIHGDVAILATYKDAYLFRRSDTWAAAFSGPPERIELPPLGQIEAVALEASGQRFVLNTERSRGTERSAMVQVTLHPTAATDDPAAVARDRAAP